MASKGMSMTDRKQLSPEEQWRYAEPSLRWHGWGSPVGLGLMLVCLGAAALLVRFAIMGF
jgi:hypothetical protein